MSGLSGEQWSLGNGPLLATDPAQTTAVDNPQWEDAGADQPTGHQSSATAASVADPNSVAANRSPPGEKVPLKFFVGGVHPECWDDELRGYFSQFGNVKHVEIMADKISGRNRGFGFVTLEDDNDRAKVFNMDHYIRGKKCNVREMQADGSSNLARKVFIGGINPALTEEELEPYFRTWGPLEKITIMRDSQGGSRGFGFAIFMEEETSKRVVDHKNHSIDKDNKVECRRAEARGRVSHSRGGSALMMGGRLPPPMGRCLFPGDPTFGPAFDPGAATFDWNPAVLAAAYGAYASPAHPAAGYLGAVPYTGPPQAYGGLGLGADAFGIDSYGPARYDPGGYGGGAIRGGTGGVVSGRGVPVKRSHPY